MSQPINLYRTGLYPLGGHPHADPDSDTDGNGYPDAHTNTDNYGNADGNTDNYGNADGNSHRHDHANRDSDSHSDFASGGDFYPHHLRHWNRCFGNYHLFGFGLVTASLAPVILALWTFSTLASGGSFCLSLG
jgi:hypothetical protein